MDRKRLIIWAMVMTFVIIPSAAHAQNERPEGGSEEGGIILSVGVGPVIGVTKDVESKPSLTIEAGLFRSRFEGVVFGVRRSTIPEGYQGDEAKLWFLSTAYFGPSVLLDGRFLSVGSHVAGVIGYAEAHGGNHNQDAGYGVGVQAGLTIGVRVTEHMDLIAGATALYMVASLDSRVSFGDITLPVGARVRW